MKRSITEYYKATVKKGTEASQAIGAVNAWYESELKLAKGSLAADDITQKRYDERIGELAAERDARIEGALSQVLKVVDEFDADMDEIGRLDGNMIDDGTMKLLNSGLTLNSADWQKLADQHRDNSLMTRILKQRYSENRPQEKNPVVVRFGQLPSERAEVFSRFAKTVYGDCQHGIMPKIGGARFKDMSSFLNYRARGSLEEMDPVGDEAFDFERDFPVEMLNGRGKKTTEAENEFNFGFTRIRNQ